MFFKRKKPLLTVLIDGKEIGRVVVSDLPAELKPTVEIKNENTSIVFLDSDGHEVVHSLGNETGWFAFSIRVHPNLACQADCIFGKEKDLSTERFTKGELKGIRFQPFFIGAPEKIEAELKGHGLFARGLHFSGTITPGNVSLSCVCDSCRKSFRLQSFHAGFSNCGYMYSESGRFTLTIPDSIGGSPPALGKAEPQSLSSLEEKLQTAPDGTAFKYLNPLRCPHCSEPYIDFEKFPEDRGNEYYGNTSYGEPTIKYEPEQPNKAG